MPTFHFSYEQYSNEMDLQESYRYLLTHARNALQQAYAPYSQFYVGCAVLLINGHIATGSNIENAAYPVGICAERNVLAHVMSNYKNEKIKAIAISYSYRHENSTTPAFPCGMCRQFIAECEEINESPFDIILAGLSGDIICVHSAKDLLPFSFGKNNLTK